MASRRRNHDIFEVRTDEVGPGMPFDNQEPYQNRTKTRSLGPKRVRCMSESRRPETA